MGWMVTFNLKEQNSVSQKKEQRLKLPAPKQQIPGDAGDDLKYGEHPWYYKPLGILNNWIGPSVFAHDDNGGDTNKKP
ncbi:hypothetical protein [Enterobacter ludwigii]|uniref:hypothetical protein n=1 Tax=Enterobacter ludwigii TaxID=299767 RepID=UPI003F707609